MEAFLPVPRIPYPGPRKGKPRQKGEAIRPRFGSTMLLEVEFKYRDADLSEVERRLRTLGARLLGVRPETDLYFAHPARDFAQSDEALRIRRVGQKHFLTYKGPKIDASSKTRYELELPLVEGDDTWDKWKTLLERLGFRPVLEVSKRRRKFRMEWENWPVEVSLDEVVDLGNFVELEIVCEDQNMVPARESLERLARYLGLQGSERRSYLELLLEKLACQGTTRSTSDT